ncbi:ABC transporter permease [Chlorobium sp. N1]|uniref:ABC transporter permease n=1 Tax=Chlorobium sp. N1 TaxID=2491138 RepID=UPI00103B1E8D|nr:ABC transporter permease [Chlorobium sp. N1]TCD47447.1 FtsX-like permease family protein [Chlorobium sp. N1]
MRALRKKLYRELWRQRAQMLAVSLVVASGISVFVSMGSVRHSLEATLSRYYARYRFADVFMQLKRAPERLGDAAMRIPGVAMVSTRVVTDVTIDIPGVEEPATGRLISIPDYRDELQLNGVAIVSGRSIEPEADDEVVVSRPFLEANHLQPGETIAAVINGRRKELRIVGAGLSPEYVYEVQPGAFFPDSRHFGIFWMGRRTLESALGMSGAFNDISLTLQGDASEGEVIEGLDRLFARYGSLGAYGRSGQISDRFITDEIRQVGIQVTFLPAVFMGVGVFLLHIIMSRTVAVQRGQIALMKAMGYSGREVGMHYLGVALLPAAAGSVLGSLLGLWLGRGLMAIYADFYNFPNPLYLFRASDVLLGTLLSFSSALAGAASAVRRAGSLPPAEAMRPESPHRYRSGVLDRLQVLMRLPVPVKMVVRSLERRPWKAAISVCMVALAVAILISGRYAYDAVERMVELEFTDKHREDLTLLFNDPMPPSITSSIASLEGVIEGEYYREEPARLFSGHRSRRQPIRGLPGSSGLQRLIDSQGRNRRLPPEGVILTTELASILGVRAGDSLGVEFLQGERRSGRVYIAGTMDEILGLSASMDLDALNRLAGDGGVVNGAFLRTDPARTAQLYRELKATPGVSGVMMVKALRQSFDELIARSMTTSTLILTVFACVLAFAVVYNWARISLSERARELASLRILGMTKGEISFILLAEQALITAAAILPGYLMGIGLSALLSCSLSSELYRMPLVFTNGNFLFAFAVVAAVSALSGLAVRGRLLKMDLIEVLKTRE